MRRCATALTHLFAFHSTFPLILTTQALAHLQSARFQIWAGHGLCQAKIIGVDQAESSLYPGRDVTVYTVKYDIDGTKEDLEEAEIRQLLIVSDQLAASDIPAGLMVVSPGPAH